MITLYKPNETDFTHNGIGALDKNIYNATVEEELNGLFLFSFSYPLFAPRGLEIEGMSIIKVPTPDGEQLFRVAAPKVSMGEITAQCYHIFYDLTENLIEDIFAETTNGNGAMNRMSAGCQYKHPFQFYSDVPKIASARIVRKNPVEALLDSSQDNSFVNRWGGELKRDNFDVKMLLNRGMDRGVVIRHKKDLLGYEGNVDWKSPITRIMPQGFDGLFLPEKYVDSPLINKYPHPKIKVVEFKHIKAAIGENADDEDAVPLEEAYRLLRQAAKDMFAIQKVDQPKANYNVKFQELSQTEEYKDYKHLQSVYMADTVTVEHQEDGIDIKAKVIAYKYDPIKKEYLDITIGNFKESFTDVSGRVDLVQEELSNMPGSILDAAKANATSLINSGFGGHVRVYPDRILIMDTKDEKSAKKVWQWNLNGLGYSSTGVNGPYGTAITSDGRIVADFITAGTLSGNLVQGGEITGATLRTSDSVNYVNISKQFIRLYESSKTRVFVGYYKNSRNEIQPTLILGGDSDSTGANGAIMVYQFSDTSVKSGGIGITKGLEGNGYLNAASLYFSQTGNAMLDADKTIVLNAQSDMRFKVKDQFRFYRNDNWIASIGVSSGGDTDIVLPNAMIRNSSYENGYIQIKTALGSYYHGIIASDFKVSSKETYKTNIRPIAFSALEKVMEWEIKQYNLKNDIPKLYEMRMNRKEGELTITTDAIPTHYGLVIPKEAEENGVGLYGMLSQLTSAFQEHVIKTDARLEELEPLKPKGNIKHRNRIKRQRRPPRHVKRSS
ncbi:phage tail spike protein [Bacillus thuringiensis]|uniref:phage tail spike protein n=2 Tax=Bacillus thuringiensis TaxID=1428 RepID=UPI002DBA5E2A|nr:phage tail spike protein [Bacillus thuringiensis]MEC3362445.1 phage tail spike protein [Bacillus thuringiensis]MEC3406021.1 phage tail spike protein [Bacillus thuringiensis]MEC3426215.1 phage tail spike protein [Bacillus thuringiensis]MED2392482.1 phage tail spike protein [Bacillus thuringiensis]MED2535652.1 phage tail spike protein [Bacillus thuringiensis]